MKNEIYERDYRTKKEPRAVSQTSSGFDYIVESELFKAYSDAIKKIPKYIVQENKEEHMKTCCPALTPMQKNYMEKSKTFY